jgi:hypothetical protein
MAAFVSLCQEMELLQHEAETQFYAPLHIYGEGMRDGTAEQEGDAQLCFSKMLPVLQVRVLLRDSLLLSAHADWLLETCHLLRKSGTSRQERCSTAVDDVLRQALSANH